MIVTTPPESLPYCYGHITRENAELILFDRGCVDGMYLLRASHGPDAGYVLSLCHNQQVVHYRIIKDVDDLYYLPGMAHDKYVGPIELIQSVKEFAGLLNIPCLKPLDVFMPGVNCSVPEDKLKEAVRKKSTEWGIQESDFGSIFGDKQNEVWGLVLKTLHEYESWFHGRISREESEARLIDSGLTNGKFLVRERDPCSFTLSLCHEGLIKHYKIDVLSSGEVGIHEGPRFENIISLVSHYSVFSDGLWCQLQQPCISENKTSSVEDASISRASAVAPTNGACGVKSPPSQQATSKSSNLKATSIWFINHLPRFNKDNSSQNSNQPATTKAIKVQQPPAKSSKSAKFTKLDISSPVIARPAPPPPTNTSTCPALATTSQSTDVNEDTTASNPVANAIRVLPQADGSKQQLNLSIKQNELSASTQVPLRCILPSICPTNVEDSASSKRPLPAPRHRRALPVPVILPIDAVSPSPLSLNTQCTAPSSCASVVPPVDKTGKKSEHTLTHPPTTASTMKILTLDNVALEEPDNDDKESGSQKIFSWMKNASESSNMINVIKELKDRSTKNGQSCDTDEGERQSVLSTAQSSAKSCELPQYEEIDPEFKETEPDCDTSTADAGNNESLLNLEVKNAKWDNTKDNSTQGIKNEQQKPPWTKEESEFHFKTIRRYRKGPTAIDRKNLLLQEKIGLGNFGDVVKAVFISGQVEVPCAIKTLRQEAISSGKEDILREARIMTKLDHAHIVRLFGVSEGDPFLLVMELAPLGPLNSYVRMNMDVSPRDILLLIYQVALGMEYLESKQFVHRDLAARNVLLVNESFAKISDFGMSRALGLHSDYYRVEPQAKLPLKWYAPECIYYFRFSCKSDVWSFGITMWEALSYGERPYQGLAGHEILTMFSTNRRLKCPEKCSQEMYAVMWNCWQFRPEDRPTFAQLKSTLKDHLKL